MLFSTIIIFNLGKFYFKSVDSVVYVSDKKYPSSSFCKSLPVRVIFFFHLPCGSTQRNPQPLLQHFLLPSQSWSPLHICAQIPAESGATMGHIPAFSTTWSKKSDGSVIRELPLVRSTAAQSRPRGLGLGLVSPSRSEGATRAEGRCRLRGRGRSPSSYQTTHHQWPKKLTFELPLATQQSWQSSW